MLIVLALVLMFNYLSFRHFKRFDWTGSKIYTLSEKSLGVLGSLDKNIELVMVLSPGSQLYTSTNELLDRYVAANPQHIKRRDLDPARNPLEFERIVKSFGLSRPNVLVVARTDDPGALLDKRVIEEADLAEVDFSGAQFGQPPSIKEYKGEKQITSAILGLVEAKKPKILFTSGHGELPLEPQGDTIALSQAHELLGRDNFELSGWDGLGRGDVPAGTDLVVVAGPRSNLTPPELEALGRFIAGGGRLLFLADPVVQNGKIELVDPALRAFFAKYGIELNDDIVFDPGSEVSFFGAGALLTSNFGNHLIVDGLTGRRVLLRLACSVRPAATPPAGWQVAQLVLGSQESWAKPISPSSRRAPKIRFRTAPTPRPGAAGGRRRAGRPDPERRGRSRIVVFGDADFAGDGYLGSADNPTLLANTVNWLVARQQLIEIEGRKPEKTGLTLSSGDLNSVYALVLLLVPGAAVVAGIWIAMRRRR